jgi:hypothetical protein
VREEWARALRDVEKARSETNKNATASPGRGRVGEKKGADQVQELNRAMKLLQEARDKKGEAPEYAELLRRAAQTLGQLVRQLRELEHERAK